MRTIGKICGMMLAGLVLISAETLAQGGSEFTVPFSDPSKRGKLKASLNYGSITVKGSARKDVLVKYREAADKDNDRDKHRGKGSESSSREGLKRIGGGGLELNASENGNYVKISSGSWNVKTDLEIEVPSGIDLVVSTYNDGDLMISGIQGELELTNYNGEITAMNISGSVVATTYNGEIKVTFDKVIEGKPMSYVTYNGDIDITYPAATKASFKMKTDQGDIYTGFEMTVTTSGPVKQQDKSGNFRLKIDEWKNGAINGGGPEMTMKTYNGDIYIRKK